ncbi:MAG: hypothetical protein PHP58_03400 [Eubacteriales bacterium]|nr:hypothetical protein [Eubacteriales bacterium]
MKTLQERVAYIHGLAEGMDLDQKDSITKLLLQILDLADEMVEEIEDLRDRTEENEDFLEALDADLADVEDAVFEDDDECSCHCDDQEEFEIQCPHCDAIVTVNEDELAEAADDGLAIRCPDCGEIIFSDEDDASEAEKEDADEDED